MHMYGMVSVTVHGVDGLKNGILQLFNRLEVIVMDRSTLEVAPQTFNQVQVRCISRVPDHRHMAAMIVKKLTYLLGVMD